MSEAYYRLGIDIGGTFTDTVLTDEVSRRVWVAKVLTTPAPQDGALQGAQEAVAAAGISIADVDRIVHATTLVPNALLQRRGATVGFLTNEGFSDMLHMARELRYDTLRLDAPIVEPLVKREHCRGIAGRLLVDGTEHRPIEEGAVRQTLRELAESGIEAIAVSLMHSYVNPVHEQQVARLIADELGGIPVSLSSEIAPEIREYERATTTVINAYVQPLIETYQRELVDGLRERGYQGPLHVMMSSGGIATTDITGRFPSRLVESGPAAGVLAAARIAADAEIASMVAFDVGGTTAKASSIQNGHAARTARIEVARTARFMKGSGLPVQLPSVDLIEIGAGGGSIASLDSLGLLKVGPESAESNPGPACYGLGGQWPTVTDANLLLGYLDPEGFAGGTMTLDPTLSERVYEQLGAPLGKGSTEMALAVIEMVNETMAGAIRVHLAEHGQDPARTVMLGSGGGGPLHGVAVARKLGMSTVVLPARAGVLSATGLLVAPPAVDVAQSKIVRLDASADWEAVEDLLHELEAKATESVMQAGVAADDLVVRRSADLRWVGQTHVLTTALPAGPYAESSTGSIIAAFNEECRRVYGVPLEATTLEALTWRVSVSGPEASLNAPSDGDGADPMKGQRRVVFWDGGETTATVYDRYALPTGFEGDGPAVIEERESTAIIGPHDRFRIDAHGNLIVSLRTAKEER